MKELFGSPGKKSGLIVRFGQCFCALGSIWIMASASGFCTTTVFCSLMASMGLQFVWSFELLCLDINDMRFNRDLYNHFIVILLGDWVTATLSLAAASSSAGVMVLFSRDTNICAIEPKFSCSIFQRSITLAFVSWFLSAYSSYVTFWLVASF